MGLNLRDIEEGEDVRLNVLVYGLLEVGKTTFLGSAQECSYTSPVLFLDIEGGTLSISGSGIKIVRPRNFTEIQEIYDFLRFENTTYRSVAVDSLTELQRKLSMGEILGVLEEDASFTNLAGHTPPDRYDWLSSGEQMRRFIRAFRDLAYHPDEERRIHVLFAAYEKVDEKNNVICPALPGQLGLEIGASVDVLAHMSFRQRTTEQETTKTYRHMALKSYANEDGMRCLAKSRVPKGRSFPSGIWQPNVDKLVSLWMASSEAEGEPIKKVVSKKKTRR